MIEKTVAQVEKSAAEAVDKTKRIIERDIRQVWSILDAASEKQTPSDYLSRKAISAIHGRREE